MKKLALLLLLAVAPIFSWAQDIIVTTNSERIDAKVTEVSDKEVKYKRADNPNGPLYVLSTAKIASIVYKNGSVTVFNDKQAASNKSVNVKDEDDLPAGGVIQKIDDYYWMGDKRMNEETYFKYIEDNCEEAWDRYCSGRRMTRAGFALLGIGSGFTVLGITLSAVSGYTALYTTYTYTYNPRTGEIYDVDTSSDYKSYSDYGMYAAGVAFSVIGSATLAASVPLIVVGTIRKKTTLDTYNEECTTPQKPAMSLNLQSGRDGLGLAFKF